MHRFTKREYKQAQLDALYSPDPAILPVKVTRPIRNTVPLVGRNEGCPYCFSGRKFKHCHGAPIEGTELVPARFAGHPQERPALFAYLPRAKVVRRPARES